MKSHRKTRPSPIKITLHGAAGEVTGSAYLVEVGGARVLVDFGLFQGGARAEAKNVIPAGLEPHRLDAVLVTHAHLDHTGRLPLLIKGGYTGSILATQPTFDLAGLILRDSAKVQSFDVQRTNRKRARAGKAPVEPLYDAAQVEQTMERFRAVAFDAPIEVAAGVTARFVEAGHMLGSASIELTIETGGRRKSVIFSGDLGPSGMALIRDAVPLHRADLALSRIHLRRPGPSHARRHAGGVPRHHRAGRADAGAHPRARLRRRPHPADFVSSRRAVQRRRDETIPRLSRQPDGHRGDAHLSQPPRSSRRRNARP